MSTPNTQVTTLELARSAVLGVVGARMTGSESDAAFLLEQYLSEARGLGTDLGTAWALLFSAATIWLVDAFGACATAAGMDQVSYLREVAQAFAADQS